MMYTIAVVVLPHVYTEHTHTHNIHAHLTRKHLIIQTPHQMQISGKKWRVDLHSKQEAGLQLSAVHLPGGVQRRRTAEDELTMRSVFVEGDLLSVCVGMGCVCW